ncbi:HK97 gp10 family phage protein [Candidatus Pacearchaeota archaeon]|nr:HK97 gp10 family phage protein [Candidatus Pacearchaeota archaeon]
MKIEGLDHFYSQINKLSKSLDANSVEPLLKEAADTLTDAVKSKAPLKTGRLKRFVVTLKMKKLGNNPASHMTKVQQRARRPVEAPHAHLVELGHKNAPPHPFFRPAYDSNKHKIYSNLVSGLKKKVESV